MFEGNHGSGKTTLAYIVASMFGCPPENITDVNCVHYSGVEDMRERLLHLSKHSLYSPKKVLILDELHELSSKSQQVLLTPLEKLSKNTLVISCTTETNKIIPTLLERFIRYKVSTLSTEDSKSLLEYVCEKEGITLPKWLKFLLVEKSEGIPRRLLTSLVKVKHVDNMEEARYLLDLGSIEADPDIFELFKMIIDKSISIDLIKVKLKKVLVSQRPETIRVTILNLIGGRLLSEYPIANELQSTLIESFKTLSSLNSFTEKANIIVGILDIKERINA